MFLHTPIVWINNLYNSSVSELLEKETEEDGATTANGTAATEVAFGGELWTVQGRCERYLEEVLCGSSKETLAER